MSPRVMEGVRDGRDCHFAGEIAGDKQFLVFGNTNDINANNETKIRLRVTTQQPLVSWPS